MRSSKAQRLCSKQRGVEKARTSFKKLSISGVARGEDGATIAGAKIYLASLNRVHEHLANTTTDENGKYSFVDVDLPVDDKDKPWGSIQVFGTAEGYAITWLGMHDIYFYSRPENFENSSMAETFTKANRLSLT